MKTHPLGKTGFEVSVLCLGCMNSGILVDEVQSFELMDQQVDAGGRFLVTAKARSTSQPYAAPDGQGRFAL